MFTGPLIDKFEKQSGQSADYLRAIAGQSSAAFFKFCLLMPMANHRKAAPKDAWHAARLVATRHEDCGPCVQVVVDMALADGVELEVLGAVWHGRLELVDADVRAAVELATAVATGAAEAVEVSAAAEAQLGRDAVVDLAFAIATARVFPTLKRALGYARSCSQVSLPSPGVVAEPVSGA